MLDQVMDQFRMRSRSLPGVEASLDAAADWLARAQDATPDDGVAANYDAKKKQWAASYPETTGYIIPTLYRYADFSGRSEFRERATRMAAWESDIQFADGGIRAGTMDADKAVATIFNTGQVLFGWAAAWEQTGGERFKTSLRHAADWLVSVQDEDGAWRQFASPFAAHAINTYNTRVAFGLARAAQVLGDWRYAQAAQANVEWALTQASDNGWLANNDLEDNNRPLTHTIAYAIRGVLEVGLATDRDDFVTAAAKMARAVAETQRNNGALPGRLDQYWRPAARWSCLTGNMQMAIVWWRLAGMSGQSQWRNSARRCSDFVQSTQVLSHAEPGRRGGIAGSWPWGGGYMRWRYPNWAVKFFMDALILSAEFGADRRCR